jgi:hypothetical protein
VLLLYAALVVVVLTYSRVGIVLTVAAALAWLALDRDRFELVAPLGVAWIAGAAVAGIALLLPGVSDDGQLHGVRVQDGLIFGAALVLGALAVVFASHVVLSPRLVRAVAVALVAIVVAALAASVVRSGGPVDFVQDRWHEFANPVGAQVPNKFQRVATVSSSNRWRWWQEAWNAFVDHPLKGTGAGTFGLTDRLERDTSLAVVEPHSAPLQDLSETGIVGFLLIATALAAAAVAIAQREHTRATIALALAAAVCVLHSLVDVDWDYVAVQGPLLLVVGALVASPARAPARRPWFVAAAAGLCALAALYSLASPWLAQRRIDAAYDAFARIDIADAGDEAKSAHALNPLAVEPLSLMALAESLAGRNGRALELYRQARDLEPKNPETWFQLGAFELDELHQPRHAYRDLNQSYTLDSYGPAGLKGGKLDQARCQVDPATCQ